MTYEVVQDSAGAYAVDWPTIERLNHSFRLAQETVIRARTVRINESSWSNPFSWSLPVIVNVEVDWEKVRKGTISADLEDMVQLMSLGRHSMRTLGAEMLSRVRRTHGYREQFKSLLSKAQRENSAKINASVDNYDGMIEAAKFTRDTSADIVGIGATLLTGGAAGMAWMGGSAALKGVAKYEDARAAGRTVGEASLVGAGNFAGQFVFGIFKLGPTAGLAKLTRAEEYFLILAQGYFEAGVCWAAGDSFAKAAQKGVLKVVGEGGAKFVANTQIGKALLNRMPVPTAWVKQQGYMPQEYVDEGREFSKKVVEKVAANVVAKIVGPRLLSGFKSASSVGGGGTETWTDDAIVYDEMLLKFAIIHMEKGVGHGW